MEKKMMVKRIHKEFTLAEAKVVGEKLGIDWKAFEVKEFRLGMNTELADGIYNPITNFASEDPLLIGKVVRSHLNEAPDYYTRWLEEEKAAGRGSGGKRSNSKTPAGDLKLVPIEKMAC